jgi:transposase InsO family protein
MIVLAHDRRNIVRTAVTEHPTTAWLSRQVTEAFPWDTAPRCLLRDRDGSYGTYFRSRIEAMGITEVITAPRSPWQNAYVERVISSIRRECLDHIVIFNERHLRRVLSSYVDYYQRTRTHLSLDKDCPDSRPIMPRQNREGRRHPKSRRLASSLRTSRRLTRTISCPPMLRGRRYASSEVSRSGFFALDNGAEHL